MGLNLRDLANGASHVMEAVMRRASYFSSTSPPRSSHSGPSSNPACSMSRARPIDSGRSRTPSSPTAKDRHEGGPDDSDPTRERQGHPPRASDLG